MGNCSLKGVTGVCHNSIRVLTASGAVLDFKGRIKAWDILNDRPGLSVVEPAPEVLPAVGDGVWRVKLVIDTKQLEEILSEQVNTEALIEKMRMVASCASLTPKKLRNILKFNGDGRAVANDSTPAIGVSNLVAEDALLMIDAGSSMVGDTTSATNDQNRDPATSVEGPIIEDVILSIDVGGPVT
uniref:Uncharacterized protein n=1 Tax=Quercus lobata TaxID=97700 RepID=A0A7N2QYW3_QUELO